MEIRSPAVSSMSISRSAGDSEISWARRTRSSVVLPMADTTTTTSSPPRRVATTCSATARMRSGSATDEPPNFWTTRPTADDGTSGVYADSRWKTARRRLRRRGTIEQGTEAGTAAAEPGGEARAAGCGREAAALLALHPRVHHHPRPHRGAVRLLRPARGRRLLVGRELAEQVRHDVSDRGTPIGQVPRGAAAHDRHCEDLRRHRRHERGVVPDHPRSRGRTRDRQQLRVPRPGRLLRRPHVPPDREGLRGPGRRPERQRDRRAGLHAPRRAPIQRLRGSTPLRWRTRVRERPARSSSS